MSGFHSEFVENFLEIIGNSDDIDLLPKSFKMFACLSSLVPDDHYIILGFTSKQGKEVREEINITDEDS